jgi:hypothetical protein
MEKEFVTYELALRMKQLGFDEPCFNFYMGGFKELGKIKYVNPNKIHQSNVLAPTWQSAFRWFREKYFIHGEPLYKGGLTSQTAWYNYDIISTIDWDDSKVKNKQYKTYEEAELACLEKLIEIVEGIESQK